MIGFLNTLSDVKELPSLEPDSEFFEKLICLSQLVALVRTKVERSHGRDMTYRPEPEIGTRIAKQLSKLGSALAVVYGKTEIDSDCYRVMQKTAIDSCVGYQLEVVVSLSRRGTSGMSTKMLAESMNLSVAQIRKIIDDMMQLNIVRMRRESNNSGRRGNKIKAFRLTNNVLELMEKSELSFKETKPTKKPSNRTKRKV